MQTETIDDVIQRLESVLDECIQSNNKAGYFIALYINTTDKVRSSIRKGEFEDGARIGRLAIAFGNRFFTEWEKWKKGEPMNKSWEIVMNAGKDNNILVLQQLLLGINVHINLDLGASVVQVMKGSDLKDIYNDFNKVNTLFADLIHKAINDVARSSRLLSIMGLHANADSIRIINFLIENARDGAWLFAEHLSKKSGIDYDKCINERDARIRRISDSLIMKTSGATKLTFSLIRLFEYKKPSRVMSCIRSGVTKKPLVRAAFSYG